MPGGKNSRAFTLLELLVVVAIVALLLVLVLPAVSDTMEQGRRAACVSNLRQIGAGIAAYGVDHEGKIPYGPKAPGFNNARNFYPSTGAPTSLLSMQDGAPVALGLLLPNYLGTRPEALFCPGADMKIDTKKELAKVGEEQAQGSYYYRHGGNTALFDNPRAPVKEPPLLLAALGENRRGVPIRALVVDTVFLCPDALSAFSVRPFSNHRGKSVNVLYADGHVESKDNANGRYSVDVSDTSQIHQAFSKILDVMENADEDGLPQSEIPR